MSANILVIEWQSKIFRNGSVSGSRKCKNNYVDPEILKVDQNISESRNCKNGAISGTRNHKNTAISGCRNLKNGPTNFWIKKS